MAASTLLRQLLHYHGSFNFAAAASTLLWQLQHCRDSLKVGAAVSTWVWQKQHLKQWQYIPCTGACPLHWRHVLCSGGTSRVTATQIVNFRCDRSDLAAPPLTTNNLAALPEGQKWSGGTSGRSGGPPNGSGGPPSGPRVDGIPSHFAGSGW